jgi:hypothetical protein
MELMRQNGLKKSESKAVHVRKGGPAGMTDWILWLYPCRMDAETAFALAFVKIGVRLLRLNNCLNAYGTLYGSGIVVANQHGLSCGRNRVNSIWQASVDGVKIT